MKKLNGYRPSHRNKWKFIEHGVLKVQELALLEYYADIMDFDKHHDKFGHFEVDYKEISIHFNNTENTIRGWHIELLRKGLIKKTTDKKTYILSCFERYIGSGKWGGKADHFAKLEKNQSPAVMFQNFGTNFQFIGKKSQNIGQKVKKTGKKIDNNIVPTTQPKPIAIDSSKDEVKVIGNNPIYEDIQEDSTKEDVISVDKDEEQPPDVDDRAKFKKKIVVIRQTPRSEEEYRKIKKDMSSGLSIENMRWIDENVEERIEIRDDAYEKEIVRIYFDGDWEEYKRNLLP